jgi:hypothetical protein
VGEPPPPAGVRTPWTLVESAQRGSKDALRHVCGMYRGAVQALYERLSQSAHVAERAVVDARVQAFLDHVVLHGIAGFRGHRHQGGPTFHMWILHGAKDYFFGDVIEAARAGSDEAVRRLCSAYYTTIRDCYRAWPNAAERDELAHDLIVDLLRKGLPMFDGGTDEAPRRLHYWLRGAARNHLRDHRRAVAAQKHNGGVPDDSLDRAREEGRLDLEPSDDWTPEDDFHLGYIHDVIRRIASRLSERDEYIDKPELLHALLQYAVGESKDDQRTLAARIGTTHANFRTQLTRCLDRVGTLFWEELGRGLGPGEDIAEHIALIRRTIHRRRHRRRT